MKALALALLALGCGASEPEPPLTAGANPVTTTTLRPPRLPRPLPRRFEDPPPWAGHHDFDLDLGASTEDGAYIPLSDGDEIPIVRGAQALIHLEIDFRVWLQAAAPLLRVQVIGETHVGCGASVAGFAFAKRLPIYALDDGSMRPASPAVLIFDQPNPEPYIDKDCCVTLAVGIWRPGQVAPAEWSTAERRLRCVEGSE